jgi:hypothetical protein
MEIYERSRQRNHNHHVSASSSLAWAQRSLGDGGMASTHGVPNQESKINCAWAIALLIASGPPYDTQPTGFAEVISDGGHEARQLGFRERNRFRSITRTRSPERSETLSSVS